MANEDIFIPRDYETITAGMLDWVAGDPNLPEGLLPTDLVPGSLELAHMEAVALSMEEYEVRTAQAVLRAIPEACFRAFGFGLQPAVAATGTVIFSTIAGMEKDLVVPLGTQLRANDGTVFKTLSAGIISASSGVSGQVPIVAQELGPKGNLPPGFITRIAGSIPGVDLVNNPSATVGGSVAESEDARGERFGAFLRSLVRGTVEALEFGAISTGLVSSARAIEPGALIPRPQGVTPAGTVWLFVDDGGDGISLNPNVEATVTRTIFGYRDGSGLRVPGWKAAGVVVRVLPSPKVPVRVHARLSLTPGGGARWQEIQDALNLTLQAVVSTAVIGEAIPYGRLSATLRLADPDIQDLTIWVWRADEDAPDLNLQPLARDISPVIQSDALSYGARCVLDTDGASWVLA